VKVVVDHDMCEGHGKCQQAAPGIFELRDDDLSYVLVDEVRDESQDRVRQAVRLCPRQAIKIIEES
jgi:ferredoxin